MNGEIVTAMGVRVDPESDVVAVDGIPVSRPTSRTILLNKPAGYITTRSDPGARDTVMSLVPSIPGLHPIGRLDKNTTGLLLLTNDGALTYALTHPKHHVDKTYLAWVHGHPDAQALAHLRHGVMLEDGMTAPAAVRLVHTEPGRAKVEITIHEGRKRQVRRMLEAVGHAVLSLTRLRVGPLGLGDLPEGAWRNLTQEEIRQLKAATGLPRDGVI